MTLTTEQMQSKPQKTKISITQHGKKFTTTLPHSHVKVGEVAKMIKGLLLAGGWSAETIEEYIKTDE